MITFPHDLARGRIFFRNATFVWVVKVGRTCFVPICDLQMHDLQMRDLQMRDFSEVVRVGGRLFFSTKMRPRWGRIDLFFRLRALLGCDSLFFRMTAHVVMVISPFVIHQNPPTSKKTPQPNPIEAFFTMKFKFHPYSATTIHLAPFPSLLNKVTT